MRAINLAYETLRDPKRRKRYDAQRAEKAVVQPPAPESLDKTNESPNPTSPLFWQLVFGVIGLGTILGGLIWWSAAQRGRPQQVVANWELANAMFQRREYHAVLPALRQLSNKEPSNPSVWDMRWKTESALGLNAAAADSLQRLVQLNPTDIELRDEHARIRFLIGDLPTAHAELMWLRANEEETSVVRLIEAFRAHDPQRTSQLLNLR